MADLYEVGINSVIPSQRAIPATLLDPKIKNRSRLWYQMANIEVAQLPGNNNWALLIDPDGFIAEGTGDNFFLVKDGVLYTPEGRNILRGISRAYVIEIAKGMGIEVREQNLEPYDLYCADEAFLTGTPFCILPTTHLNGLSIGSGKMGPMTKELLQVWSKNVGLDIVQQIKHYGAKIGGSKDNSAPTPYQFK
jgi:branched-chain amino acid aminotransferase